MNEDICVWYNSYLNNSTTFQDVDETHPTLAKCKYKCDGYEYDCDKYVSLIYLEQKHHN